MLRIATLEMMSEAINKFQDMKIKEIGEVMQIPEGTAKVMIHRGRKILKRILVEEMGYEESNV